MTRKFFFLILVLAAGVVRAAAPSKDTALSSILLPYREDPAEYVEAVKESILLYNPDARAQSSPIGTSGDVQLAFELWNPKQPGVSLEWHLARVSRQADGLLVHDFVYHDPVLNESELGKFRQQIAQARLGWEKDLASAAWPAPAAASPAPGAWNRAVRNIRWYIHSPHVFVEKLLIDAPFSLHQLPKPPEHAWLYVRPAAELAPGDVPVFLEAVRAFRATGLDLKKQPSVTNASLAPILEPSTLWPLAPGWRSLIDGLRYLNLKGTPVNDDAASVLAQMTPLQVLILNDVITDRGLQTIATALTNLVKFRPGGALITDRGMSALSGLHKLHRLDLSDTSVTGQGLSALKGLPLIEVDLGPAMKDDALSTLVAIPTLVHIEMAKAPVTDQGVLFLKSFTHLHTLFIGKQLDDRGLQTLSGIASLRRLDMSGARITDAGVASLAALKDLEELALSHTAVTDHGLAVVSQMRRLRFLEVSDTPVTVMGLHQLAGMPALDVISFSHKGPLKLGELKALGALPALRTVIINGAPLKPEAMDYLRRHAAPAAAAPPHASLWEALAFADAMPAISDDTDVARLVEKPSPRAISDSGLRRIHDVESELDHIIPDVSDPIAAEPEETAQNFLGEITVNAAPPPARSK